jgi:hypothetical protein
MAPLEEQVRMDATALRHQVRAMVPSDMPCTRREFGLATALSAALTLGWLAVMPVANARTSGGDTRWFLLMAGDPKAVSWAPSAFRGLEPWLAHAIGTLPKELGLSSRSYHLIAFCVLTWLSLWMAGPAAYLITRRLGGAHGAGMLGMGGLMCLPMWLFFIHQPYLVDAPAMALMAWTMVAVMHGWMMVLPLMLVLTGLARETVVGFAVPIYMWLRHRWVDLSTAWQVAMMMAPAVVVTWAVRQPMEHTGYQSTLGLMYAGLVKYVIPDLTGAREGLNAGYFLTYGFAGSLGIWWVLALAGRRHGGRLWWLLVPVSAQWMFGSDYGRYALYAFPVVIAAGAMAVWEHPRRRLLFGLVVAQSLAIVADLVVVGHPAIYTWMPSLWISAGLMLVTAFVLWWPARHAVPEPAPASRTSSYAFSGKVPS